MRVAFVADLATPVSDTTARGADVVLSDLAHGLYDRGHDVVVFCAQGSYLRGVECAPVLAGHGYDELAWLVERWQPDVISLHSVKADTLVARGAVPSVHVLHRPPCADVAPGLRAANALVVAPSRDSERRWRAAGVTNVRYVPHAVPAFPVAPREPEAMALIAGRICADKGTAVAIRAAKRAGLAPLVVGEVTDRSYFAREVAPLLEHVNVSRPLPRDRVDALMARAAVTLASVAYDEPFGLVAAEAQMAGCPVVGYTRGALPEVVPHEEGGVLVAPDDEDALVRAIPYARTMPRDAIRESARHRFSLTNMIDAHEALLLEATGGTSERAAA